MVGWVNPIPEAINPRSNLVSLPHLPNPSGFDEVWQLEGRLLNPALALKVLALLGPVPGYADSVAVRLQCLCRNGKGGQW